MLAIKNTLKELRQVNAQPAVSIFVPTHRTFPDNQQDAIAIKNQLKIAEERITAEYDKRIAQAVLENIEAQLADWDHNYNLDSLAIFATSEEAQAIRLPFDVDARVNIGEKFATRSFMRHLSQSFAYYILLITRDKARLIEGANNRLVKEITAESLRQQQMDELTFPINNTSLPTGSKADRTGSADDDKYLKEFFNRVDKSLQQFYNQSPLPVILVGETQNLGAYEQVCDNPNIIIGKLSHLPNLEDGHPQSFIDGVQELVQEQQGKRYEEAKAALEKARNENLLRTDLQAIYRAAFEGNALSLIVRQGYRVPATIDEKELSLKVEEDATKDGVTDDAVGEIIELVSHNGGEVVFLPADESNEKEPIALVTRY